MNQQNFANFIWNVAEVLRGGFKQPIYGRIILPLHLVAPPGVRAGADSRSAYLSWNGCPHSTVVAVENEGQHASPVATQS